LFDFAVSFSATLSSIQAGHRHLQTPDSLALSRIPARHGTHSARFGQTLREDGINSQTPAKTASPEPLFPTSPVSHPWRLLSCKVAVRARAGGRAYYPCPRCCTPKHTHTHVPSSGPGSWLAATLPVTEPACLERWGWLGRLLRILRQRSAGLCSSTRARCGMVGGVGWVDGWMNGRRFTLCCTALAGLHVCIVLSVCCLEGC
jgi:hypothetical protein